MRAKIFYILWCTFFVTSCKSYLDIQKGNFTSTYMTFDFNENYNELNYFNKINAGADNEVFYTTHFSINLPKHIRYWLQTGNKFYFEYDSKQIIYIYTAFKNVGKDSDKWELQDINNLKQLEYFEEFCVTERKYDMSELEKPVKNRTTKLYTNGKYKILLLNIKDKNFTSFFDFIKTFKINP